MAEKNSKDTTKAAGKTARKASGKLFDEDLVVEDLSEETEDTAAEPEAGETEAADTSSEKVADRKDASEPKTEDVDSDGEPPSGEEDTDSGDTASDEAGDKKGFFKKKKDKKDEMIEELNDKLKRQMAEFDNFRKRTEKEKAQMYDMGARNIIEKVLPVIDNFERGLAGVPEESKEDAFVVGMDKVYRQLLTELEAIGVTPIEAVGQEFNPDFHNAVMQVESEEYESGVVAQELQRGYLYKESVVRHSMVAVVS